MSKSLRIYLVIGLCLLQGAAAFAIIALTGATTDRVLVQQMDQQMSTASRTAVDNTEAVLAAAEDSADLTRRVIDTELIDPERPEEFGRFLSDELDVNELLSGVYWGAPDGSFFIVQNDETHNQDGYRTKIIDFPDGERRTTIIWSDTDYVETSREVDPTDTFDPRTRPWYQQADHTPADTITWTDPYVFATSKEPGVTVSVPVREFARPGQAADQGDLTGVVGVDVELRGLSDYLDDNVDTSPNGAVVIADRDGALIATQDSDTVVRTEGGQSRRARVDEIGNPAVAGAFAAAGDQLATTTSDAPVSVTFTNGGEDTRAVFTPLDGHRNWFVALVAPEQDYVGAIQRAQRVNAVLAVLVGFGIVLIALPLITALANRGARLHARATTDALTGLANRRHFEETLAKEIARSRDRSRPLVVAMLDLDHFKHVNDTYGHGVGDEALITVAQQLRDAMRGEDMVARLGGDEFAVLAVGLDLDRAAAVLERARAAVAEATIDARPEPINVTITIGVADLVPGVTDPAGLVRRADQALYVAKERGRNQVATIREVDPDSVDVAVPSSAPDRTAPAGPPVGG